MNIDNIDNYLHLERIKTPFYCFDTNLFAERVTLLRKKLGGCAKICYSLKANPWLVNTALHICDYIEVCSDGELQICIDSGVPLNRISIGGVSKTEVECERLSVNPPYRISVESLQQFRMLKKYAEQYQNQLHVLLRITSGNQFGMSLETAMELKKSSHEFQNVHIDGIHYYPGTQNKGQLNAEKQIEILKNAAKILKINEIQFGPGFGAALFSGQSSAEYNAYLDFISEHILTLSEKYSIVIECGRYLTYPVGTYTTTILDIKEQNGRYYLIVDGGIHQISYYGQINGKPQPVVCHLKTSENMEIKCCTVCGSLCTVSDILAKDISLSAPQIGDRLVFANVGAYSVTEARSLFLSRDLPAVFLKDKEDLILARKASALFNMNEMEGVSCGTRNIRNHKKMC